MPDDITVSDLEIMSHAVNYRRWLYGQVASHVGRRVFEIGAGIGNYTEFLLNRDLVVALEPHGEAAARLQERFSLHPHVRIVQGDMMDASLRALAEHGCDTAICFNVLEHIEHDQLALENIRHILVPGGRLLLIVPALPFIMGTVDQSLGHYRRYTRDSLRAVVQQAGFRVERNFYMNFPGIWGWLWNNRIVRRTEESRGQIGTFDRWFVPWVARLERVLPPPIGLSVVCIASC